MVSVGRLGETRSECAGLSSHTYLNLIYLTSDAVFPS